MHNILKLLMFSSLAVLLSCSGGPTVSDLESSGNDQALAARVRKGGADAKDAALALIRLGKSDRLAVALKDMDQTRRAPVLDAVVARLEKDMASGSASVETKDLAVRFIPMVGENHARKLAGEVIKWFLADPESRASLGTVQFPAVVKVLWRYLDRDLRERAMMGAAAWMMKNPDARSDFGLTYYREAHPRKGTPSKEARERYSVFRKALVAQLLTHITVSDEPNHLRKMATLFYAYANEKERRILGAKLLKEMVKRRKISSPVPVGLLGDLKPSKGVAFLSRLINPRTSIEVVAAALRALCAYKDSPRASTVLIKAAMPALRALSGRRAPSDRELKLAYEAAQGFTAVRVCPDSMPGGADKVVSDLLKGRYPESIQRVLQDMSAMIYKIHVCSKGLSGIRDVLKRLGDVPSMNDVTVAAVSLSGLPKEQRNTIVRRLLGSKRPVDVAVSILSIRFSGDKDLRQLLLALREDSRRVQGWNVTIGKLAREVLESPPRKEGD